MYQGHLREYYKILLIATAGDTRGSRTATYFLVHLWKRDIEFCSNKLLNILLFFIT